MTNPPEGLPRLVTCSYTGYSRDKGTAVKISIGAPRWIHLPDPRYSKYAKWPYLQELAPRPDYLRAARPLFRTLYLQQLDRLAADIDRKLQWIEPEHGTLALLCFEKQLGTDWCHRTMTAEWLEQRYGIAVAEVGGGR